ncbi:class I SAM-dependent methyltransferase [Tenggerimyces flavus]|uniref:Class I SAM-dependent methyltransferase n=1 Tax=Tenggerimyces flavus TaxID=1708749 RepID=A0ABV7Y3P4_9ACTN|nr:class I SAM-dependent methyltransferase [Tenggerimyces flavus]MBM7790856.1 SAM-dependent methyltransferase [Tenggerimyces flavus]
MTSVKSYDERDLYLGLAAEHWGAISDTDPREDQEYFQRVIESQNGRALELGCGAGRLLLAYLRAGLDVAGSDISGDMLAMLRRDAEAAGLEPEVYEQPMQELDVPGTFRTIYVPCGSFVCVMDREQALETLRRCHAQLDPGGVLVFNLFLFPYDYSAEELPTFPGPWEFKAEKSLPDGRRLVISNRDTGLDPVEQVYEEERKYELYEDDRLVRTEVRTGQGRWYFRNELLWMVRIAGFEQVEVTGDYTDDELNPSHRKVMVVRATRR